MLTNIIRGDSKVCVGIVSRESVFRSPAVKARVDFLGYGEIVEASQSWALQQIPTVNSADFV